MTPATKEYDELYCLLDDLCDGSITVADAARLDDLLQSDPSARKEYLSYLDVHAGLGLISGKQLDCQTLSVEPAFPPLSPLSSLPTTHYPLPTTFVGGPVFSYMVATVVLCLMLLGAWAYKISHVNDSHFVGNSPRSTTSGPVDRPELVFVGRVTGMKDCRWSATGDPTLLGASVSLDREYALAAGLLEITYKSGARVILEGPCTYKVDTDAGGYLARGKLTARIDGAKPQAANPEPRTPNPEPRNSSFIPHPSSLFAVRTPTAIITDLGTEFGVEVAENGDTVSHVFQGSIKVQGLAASVASVPAQIETTLREDESIRVSRVRETHQDSGVGNANPVRFTHPTTPPKFVRLIREPLKNIDLLDIVAGGDGLGKRREHGIDPATGLYDHQFVWALRGGDRQYHPVTWHEFIDGVFVPDGREGAIPIDSAGHVFAGFPTTSGEGYGSIWARAAEVDPKWKRQEKGPWVYIMDSRGKFMPRHRGLLCLSPNAGVTFDLKAMREAYRDVAPNRFRAVAGLVDNRNMVPTADGLADLWIFIDGTLKMKRTQLRPDHEIILVDIEIAPNARYLTLVSTDGGNGYTNDYVVFGDPVLEMAPTD